MNANDIITLVIGLLSITTNGILMIILYKDPVKKFRTSTNYLIISLTLSDFLTGAAGFTYAFQAKTLHPFVFPIFWSTIFSSFVSVFLLSCERFVIVLYPLRAKSIITMHRVLMSIAANWTVSIIIGGILGGLKGEDVYYVLFVGYTFILVFVLILIVFYSIIIKKIKGNTKFQRNTICRRAQSIIQQEQRLTGVLFLLVTILMLTVIPYVVVALVITCYHIFGNQNNIPENLLLFSRYYFPIELLNFAVNPIIYAWRLPAYRQSLVYYLVKLPLISKKLQAEEEPINTQNMSIQDSNI